ncbi:MAG: hypothetical protein K0A89_04455 [ANME-2 cluster archaeon]|nr:hypothetical protein [ANME-2 cluster archaeon]
MANHLTTLEKIGLYSTIIAAVFLIIWSFFSVISGFISNIILDVIVGTLFLFIGGFTLIYAVKIYRKVLYLDELLDSSFENGIYRRLGPLVNVLAETQVEVKDFSIDLKMLLNKVENIESEMEHVQGKSHSPSNAGISDNFVVRNILLVLITLSLFIYFIEVTRLITVVPYVIPIIFFGWWFFLTNQFKIFHFEDAWVIGFAPIIIVPITSIFLNSIFDITELLGILFLLLGLYIIGYYIWCSYKVNGQLPFNIHHELREAFIELNKKEKNR